MTPLSIYEYQSYKTFVREYIKQREHGGRGTFRQMAEALKVHTTLISQIFRGTKDLSPEQAHRVAEFLKLDTNQTEYFLTLVELERTTYEPLRDRVKLRLETMRQQSQLVKNRMRPTQVISDEAKARFYSAWHYAAIRLATDINTMKDAASIAAHLQIPKTKVLEVLDFLAANGLVVEEGHRYKLGPSRTHLDQLSPFTPSHHRNWRLKAMEHHDSVKESELSFTAPMTLSVADFSRIRELILSLIRDVDRTVRDSPSEVLACLNVDLFMV